MNWAISRVLWLVAALMMAAGCGKPDSKPPSAAQPPVVQPVQDYDEFTGRVAAIDAVEIRSRVGGYIQHIGFDDGDEVAAGQVLFQIDPRPFRAELDQAKAQLTQAKAEADSAHRELARIESLAQTGTASTLELQQQQDKVAAADAAVAKAIAAVEGKQLSLDFATVKSPISGRASNSLHSVGNLVSGDTLLTTVVSFDPINVNIDVDENRLLKYREMANKRGHDNRVRIREAKLPILVALANEKEFSREGIVDFTDNQIDPLTGTIRVRGLFNNADRALVPNLFVRARLPLGDPSPALLVPDRALGRDQDRKYLLVVNEQNVVEHRPVEIGGLFDGNRVILSGITPGDRVIVDGIQRARPGRPVTPTSISPTSAPAAR